MSTPKTPMTAEVPYKDHSYEWRVGYKAGAEQARLDAIEECALVVERNHYATITVTPYSNRHTYTSTALQLIIRDILALKTKPDQKGSGGC